MAAREALAAQIDHKTLLIAYKQVVCRQILGGAAQFSRARRCHKNSAAFVQSHTCGWYSFDCPASPEKEDQRAAGSPAALTQLALCLRLAIDLKGRKLATRCNPQ